ncbi:MAG TPA: hypothetical protein VGS96_03350 [Thermoanaerobaculia bacterium]|jgi:hypothetical protein|nr:hypothetical protein [Thermoanaerobaculia bacterium]
MACAVLLFVTPLTAATIKNDDSCDIGTYPAATLLLPYFEVELARQTQSTIFSITNVSPAPQIARVTIWTDWAFPVISFNLFLTGYDVQPINLYDVFLRGIIGGATGTSTSAPNARDSTGRSTNPNIGTTPLTNLANPNFLPSVANECARGRLPGVIPASIATDIRALVSTGRSTGVGISCRDANGVEQQVGGNHGGTVAIGYVTIDVVATCSAYLPTDARYWNEILFDNVLTGDYQQIASDPATGNYAGGNPMVHIRAIPEGGDAGSTAAAALPFTFYDRYTSNDRRQPVPSTFAARWISGSNATFDTHYKIWREGVLSAGAACNRYAENSSLSFGEIARFDEHENAWITRPCSICIPGPPPIGFLPVTSRIPISNALFPVNASTDLGGWTYFNLNSGGIGLRKVSQNWVVVSMFAEGRFGVESDATSLGNGCSPAAALTQTTPIGPAH